MHKHNVANNEWWVDQDPNPCPLCHYAIDARYLIGVVRKNEPMGTALIELVFQCPRRECLRVFIGRYEGYFDRNVNHHTMFLRATAPYSPVPPTHPEEVVKLSSTFNSIFGEAAAAEAWGLRQVAGCAYRKALEFLIKDFCIAQHPADADAIASQLLGKVIQERLEDQNIKEIARRAAWIGNDETHYVRVWVDRDIDDLKALIALTVSWINTHLLSKKYVNGMPRPA